MNIAVFLPGWIGDAVMATPALRALRQHFAQARFIGIMKPYVAGVLEKGPWFDVIEFAGDGSWAGSVFPVARLLRRHRIDMAILFPNSFRTALIAWLGGCKERIGYARYGRGPLLTKRLQPACDERGSLKPSSALDAYNSLAEAAGCPLPSRQMELFTTTEDELRADQVWSRGSLANFREVVCLNPGAAFGSAKYWPSEYFVELARRLAQSRGSGVLVLCGPSEKGLANAIVKAAAHPSVSSLANFPLSLGLTKACIRRSDLLITTDSGPRHFAAAFDKPVITLFGPTHIAWTETYHPRSVHLQKKVDCGPCQLRTCPLDHRCMRDLKPSEVLAAVAQLLDGVKDEAVGGPSAHDAA
jgi:heptosyltransferase-2